MDYAKDEFGTLKILTEKNHSPYKYFVSEDLISLAVNTPIIYSYSYPKIHTRLLFFHFLSVHFRICNYFGELWWLNA